MAAVIDQTIAETITTHLSRGNHLRRRPRRQFLPVVRRRSVAVVGRRRTGRWGRRPRDRRVARRRIPPHRVRPRTSGSRRRSRNALRRTSPPGHPSSADLPRPGWPGSDLRDTRRRERMTPSQKAGDPSGPYHHRPVSPSAGRPRGRRRTADAPCTVRVRPPGDPRRSARLPATRRGRQGLAGGQSLIPLMKLRFAAPARLRNRSPVSTGSSGTGAVHRGARPAQPAGRVGMTAERSHDRDRDPDDLRPDRPQPRDDRRLARARRPLFQGPRLRDDRARRRS